MYQGGYLHFGSLLVGLDDCLRRPRGPTRAVEGRKVLVELPFTAFLAHMVGEVLSLGLGLGLGAGPGLGLGVSCSENTESLVSHFRPAFQADSALQGLELFTEIILELVCHCSAKESSEAMRGRDGPLIPVLLCQGCDYADEERLCGSAYTASWNGPFHQIVHDTVYCFQSPFFSQ